MVAVKYHVQARRDPQGSDTMPWMYYSMWPTCISDMTRMNIVTWHVWPCDMTCKNTWHDTYEHVTWQVWTCDWRFWSATRGTISTSYEYEERTELAWWTWIPTACQGETTHFYHYCNGFSNRDWAYPALGSFSIYIEMLICGRAKCITALFQRLTF